jgi:hypothetical protein
MDLRRLPHHSLSDCHPAATTPETRGSADTSEDLPLPWAALAGIGAVAGWSSGFFGIGGGLAITALMTGLLKVSQHRSQAISLAVTALPVTLPAALLYVQQGAELPWLTIISLIVGLWIGTDIGARFANRVSPDKLRVVLMDRNRRHGHVHGLQGVAVKRLYESSPRRRGPIRRGLAFKHWGGGLLQQATPGVMGPRLRGDDTKPRAVPRQNG